MSRTPPFQVGQSVAEWARDAEFPQPLRWGDIEAPLLTRSIADEPPPGRKPLVWPFALFLGVPSFGIAFIGLAVVLAVVGGLVDPSEGWLKVAEYAFVGATAMPFVMVSIWNSSGRLRSWPNLLQTGGTGAAALVALLLERTAPWAGDNTMLPWWALAATATGFGAFGYLSVASRGWRRRTPRRLRPQSPEELVRNRFRGQVLQALDKRGLISRKEVCFPDMLQMPLGSWHELDPPR